MHIYKQYAVCPLWYIFTYIYTYIYIQYIRYVCYISSVGPSVWWIRVCRLNLSPAHSSVDRDQGVEDQQLGEQESQDQDHHLVRPAPSETIWDRDHTSTACQTLKHTMSGTVQRKWPQVYWYCVITMWLLLGWLGVSTLKKTANANDYPSNTDPYHIPISMTMHF